MEDMSDAAPENDLENRLKDLREILEELRGDLRPSRGRVGLPRPPTPREVLRFTDEYAIPAAIAVLEVNVRTLELLQRGIRLAEEANETDPNESRTLERHTLDRLDQTLDAFETTLEDSRIVASSEARRLLRDARRLNAEIRDRTRSASREHRERGIEIEVEEELDRIKEESEREDE